MEPLTRAQQDDLYRQHARRTGIHAPILTALHQVQATPLLADGTRGLGVSPANQMALTQVDTLTEQVAYAADALRSLTDRLTVEGWPSKEIWDVVRGQYQAGFVRAIARGYTPTAQEPDQARLEPCAGDQLWTTYSTAVQRQTPTRPADQRFLETALVEFVQALPAHYQHLPHQQTALYEMARLWQKQDTVAAALQQLDAGLMVPPTTPATVQADGLVLQLVQRIPDTYAGYPHQREALLRLVQLWHQWPSREAAIAHLTTHPSPQVAPCQLDPVLLAQVQQLTRHYQGTGNQRQALLTGFGQWQQLSSQADCLLALGVAPTVLDDPAVSDAQLAATAQQIDQALLHFYRQLPSLYRGTPSQREALLAMVQAWQGLRDRSQTLQFLAGELAQLMTAPPAGLPPPVPQPATAAPTHWNPHNLDLHSPLLPGGTLTWATATQGGLYLPPNQTVVDAVLRVAAQLETVWPQLPQPAQVVRWYHPTEQVPSPFSPRHALGDAVAFYCPHLTGQQLYWFLDPIWPGGLGWHTDLPLLCHVDLGGDRVRWPAIAHTEKP